MRAGAATRRVLLRESFVDRKSPAEGRARDPRSKKAPIHRRPAAESGVWLVAPEDKRYGQDILIPEKKTAIANASAGQVVAIE